MSRRARSIFSTALLAGALIGSLACGDNIPRAAGDCGNGELNEGEECDDSNNQDGDGCSAGCLLEARCGDGVVSGREECDDGNNDSGDGCSATCLAEENLCGNGIVDDGELCDDGNAVEYDGCEDDCTASPAEVACFDLPPATSGVCDVTAGSAARLIRGDILTPSTILRGGQVAVDDGGEILCVGCDCSGEAAGATVITCPDAVVSPGLINPHDHLTFANNVPYTDTGERYEHRHDWRRGRNGHTEISVNSGASADQIRYGELRFLMGGATSVIGAGAASGFMRNLDRDGDEQGLGQESVELEVFPLGDSSGEQLDDGCGYPDVTDEDITDYDAFSPHVSEGIDAFARNEFLCLSRTDNGGADILEPQSSFIHGIGLTPIDYTRMTDQGTLLIWTARSNVALYGNTASVTTADRLGVPIALGTDWVRTGSMNLLRELQCADSLNSTYYGGYFSDKALWEMVTSRAAAAAAMDDTIGTLLPGMTADIAIFNASTNADYRAIIDAGPDDVTLVMRGGAAIYGDDALINSLGGTSCDVLDVCSSSKRICTSDEIGMTLAQLESSVGTQYELFSCGTPTDEPSCVPARPASVNGSTIYDGSITGADADGDGIDDGSDNCPTVFNPIRPVDDGVQADFDGDGEGDLCDECPMDSGVTDCLPFDENDPDADGVPTDEDNCPEVANSLQEDGDLDDRGDACDACPGDANPAPIACPATIYEVKTGASESRVSMNDVLVTSCLEGRGFFLQVHEGEAIYAGPESSGVFLFDSDTECGVTIASGDRINISPSAQITDFFGQTQLTNATFAIQTNANPLPAATALTAAQASGSTANDFEGILAIVSDVTVTELNPAAGPGDSDPTNEFVVDDALRIDDLIHLTSSFPTVGTLYTSITGVLAFRNGDQKMLPSQEADLVPGPPTLTAFAPATSFVRVDDVAVPTIPDALTVTLSFPPVNDIFVSITSADPTSLAVVNDGVTVLAGQTTATVLVDGLLQAASVTLTADLNGDQLTADVRVLGDAEVNTVTALTPDGANVGLGGTLEMTVALEFPAGAGGETVSLAISPGTTGSTVPPSVDVAADALTATFDLSGGTIVGDEVVTASLGASSANANVSVSAIGALVINEVDYDQPGADTEEFVEILNTSTVPIDLSDIAIVLINGANDDEYRQIDLSGTLAAGQYLVVGSTLAIANADPGALTIDFGAAAIQNGAPDGIGLFQISTGLLLDAIAYENGGGGMTAVSTDDFGVVNLVEGTATNVTDPGAGSINRLPDGTDTDNSNADWALSATVTPGAANVP